MKRIRTVLSIVLILVILNGCVNQKTQNNDSQTNSIDAIESNANDKINTNNDAKDDNTAKQTDTLQTQNNIDKNKINSIDDSTKTSESKTSGNNIKENVIDYIINGQENKSESQKLKWSKTFLNKIDIDSLFKQYTESKGNPDDIEGFASYITENAPILSNWEDLFKKDLYDTYGENVVKIKHLENDLYQAYIEKDGSQVPYVVVSSKTGYFHG